MRQGKPIEIKLFLYFISTFSLNLFFHQKIVVNRNSEEFLFSNILKTLDSVSTQHFTISFQRFERQIIVGWWRNSSWKASTTNCRQERFTFWFLQKKTNPIAKINTVSLHLNVYEKKNRISLLFHLFFSRQKLTKCKSTGSLPPIYKGLFESIDEASTHVDYVLPYDIYWESKQAKSSNATPEGGVQQRKKKIERPKNKSKISFEKINKNIYNEHTRRAVLLANNAEKHNTCLCKPTDNCAEGQCLNRMVFTECSNKCPCGKKYFLPWFRSLT